MRKIWNRPDQQVWSLSTVDQNGQGNMNICTYVTCVSMEPKLLMVAVYHGTQTYQNITHSKQAILQLLTEKLSVVTRICGHQTGATVNKITRLQKRYPIATENLVPYFEGCAGYLVLQLEQLIDCGGDHDLAICSIIKSKHLNDEPLLTTNYLRAKGLLR